MDTHLRTLAKTVSWRMIATCITAFVVWRVTGQLVLGLSVGALDCILKIAAYYLHERLWSGVRFGIDTHRFSSAGAPHQARWHRGEEPAAAGGRLE